jgi:surface carbohydrate biosynthesis protein (TIGR04326 family)
MAWNALVRWGYPANRLLEVEALRFQYLQDYRATQLSKKNHTPPPDGGQLTSKPKTVLILGDYAFIQTDKMLQCIAKVVSTIDIKVSLTLKPHPACPIDVDNYPSSALVLTDRPLAEIMQDFDLVFSSNTTSAGLDAFLAGLPVMVFIDNADFNHSPLRDVEGVKFVGTAEEIASVLCSPDWGSVASMSNEFFWLDSEMPRWRQIVGKNGNSRS